MFAKRRRQKKINEWMFMNIDCIMNALEYIQEVMDDPDATIDDVRAAFKEEGSFLKIVSQPPEF